MEIPWFFVGQRSSIPMDPWPLSVFRYQKTSIVNYTPVPLPFRRYGTWIHRLSPQRMVKKTGFSGWRNQKNPSPWDPVWVYPCLSRYRQVSLEFRYYKPWKIGTPCLDSKTMETFSWNHPFGQKVDPLLILNSSLQMDFAVLSPGVEWVLGGPRL